MEADGRARRESRKETPDKPELEKGSFKKRSKGSTLKRQIDCTNVHMLPGEEVMSRLRGIRGT